MPCPRSHSLEVAALGLEAKPSCPEALLITPSSSSDFSAESEVGRGAQGVLGAHRGLLTWCITVGSLT